MAHLGTKVLPAKANTPRLGISNQALSSSPTIRGASSDVRDARANASNAKWVLGHNSKDRIMTANAGAIFLVIFFGVADLEELWLRREKKKKHRDKKLV